jgi:threonine/homoserine/homoserine lactone efflux protein
MPGNPKAILIFTAFLPQFVDCAGLLMARRA